jgi:hypothetical protein
LQSFDFNQWHNQFQGDLMLFQGIKHILQANLIFSNTLPYYEIVIKLYIDLFYSLKDQQHLEHHELSKEVEEHCHTDLDLNKQEHFRLVHIEPSESHLKI